MPWSGLTGINGRRVPPYALRHTALTRLIEAGLGLYDVARVAGHKDPSLTAAVYLHCETRGAALEAAQLFTRMGAMP